MAAKVRQNYHPDCEKAINEQITSELEAMYLYMAMDGYFCRADVSLPGLAEYFRKAAQEEVEHVSLLSNYQNKRGGEVVYQNIRKPKKVEFNSGLEAMQCALELEKEGYSQLLALHSIADTHEDYELANFLEEHFLKETVETIKELADHVTNLERVKPGHGEYHFSRTLNH